MCALGGKLSLHFLMFFGHSCFQHWLFICTDCSISQNKGKSNLLSAEFNKKSSHYIHCCWQLVLEAQTAHTQSTHRHCASHSAVLVCQRNRRKSPNIFSSQDERDMKAKIFFSWDERDMIQLQDYLNYRTPFSVQRVKTKTISLKITHYFCCYMFWFMMILNY